MRRHKHGIREGSPIANALIYLITAICCLVTVYPMYYVLIRSVSAPEHALLGDMFLLPKLSEGIQNFTQSWNGTG